MAVNKVVINDDVKLDLTQDTITPETMLPGATAHNAAGEQITGSAPAVLYEAQSLTTEQQAQARSNIGAMQGIESEDAPGCYYVPNGKSVEWINPPMAEGVEYWTTERYKGTGVPRIVKNGFEMYNAGFAYPYFYSTGRSFPVPCSAGATVNIPLRTAATYVLSVSDNVRAGVAIVQVRSSSIGTITPIVPLLNWKIEAGAGMSVNVTEPGGKYDMIVTAKML